MSTMQNVILDFSHVYPIDIEKYIKGLKRIDLSDIDGTNLYCSKEAEVEIQKRLSLFSPQGIHFLDNGNYHYATKFFVEKIHFPFSLVLFDYHNDMQKPMITDLTSCGSWAGELLLNNPYLEQLILIGPDKKSIDEIEPELKEKMVCISIQELEKEQGKEKVMQVRRELPAYISIDKDVLDRYSARTNWNQGNMSIEILEQLLSEIFMYQKVVGVDICGECDLFSNEVHIEEDRKVNGITNVILYHFLSSYFPYKEDQEEVIMREYKKETGLWNSVYAESPSVDLRKETLSVETLFDASLKKFAETTNKVLDYGCGSGDILFQYDQYHPGCNGVGIDLSNEGIHSAKKTAELSGYHNLHFFEGDIQFLDFFEKNTFDGIILSNILDVVPEHVADDLMEKLNSYLKKGGKWFIKLNPLFNKNDLDSMGYELIAPQTYGEDGILRLRQEETVVWTSYLKRYGSIENYVEFEYPWQPGLNRLYILRKDA